MKVPTEGKAVDLQARLNFTSVKSEAGDIGGQTITIAALSRTYVQQGYPVPSYFGRVVTNANDHAQPKFAENQFIGGAFPNTIIAPSITLKPVSGGVEIIARYITHVAQREELRAQLYHTAVNMLGARAST